MAWVSATYNVGFIIGPAVGGWLANPAAGSAGFRVPLFVAAALSAICVVGLALLVGESRARAGNHSANPELGRAFRATSDDADTAELMGIDNRHLYAVAMAIAMIFTALAGVLMAIRTTFDPAAGPIRLIFAFEAVIIGGLGSLWGTLLGGMVLGIAQAVGAALSPTWQILAGHIAFLVILILRPSGFFPRTRD